MGHHDGVDLEWVGGSGEFGGEWESGAGEAEELGTHEMELVGVDFVGEDGCSTVSFIRISSKASASDVVKEALAVTSPFLSEERDHMASSGGALQLQQIISFEGQCKNDRKEVEECSAEDVGRFSSS